MKNEVSSVGVAFGRVTRSKAAALKENVGMVRGKGNVLQDKRRSLRPPLSKALLSSGKTVATEPIGKRKAVLKDVTNVLCRNSSCASSDTTRVCTLCIYLFVMQCYKIVQVFIDWYFACWFLYV